MSKSVSRVGAALVALAAALSLAAAAPAAHGARSFDVVLPKTNSTYVDTGRKGYTPGDYFLATGPVLAKVGGPRIGGLAGVWTLVSPAADKASVAIHLADGTVYVDGRIRHAAKQSVLQVRGGTDAFRNARGTASFRYLSETSALIHFDLQR
jgi:hypothetical protein